MIGAAFSSFGVSTELMFLWAVNACWNSVSATVGVQVPAGSPTFTYFPLENSGLSTPRYPWANRVALLSVGSPFITSTFGLATCQAVAQAWKPWPILVPTRTLSKLT
jgi:hypothetical protein